MLFGTFTVQLRRLNLYYTQVTGRKELRGGQRTEELQQSTDDAALPRICSSKAAVFALFLLQREVRRLKDCLCAYDIRSATAVCVEDAAVLLAFDPQPTRGRSPLCSIYELRDLQQVSVRQYL